MSILHFINDWGGFEHLVADLNKTGDVQVEHDVTLTGKSGAPRQIDVLITHQSGLYKHRIIAECKYWNSSIQRKNVDEMVAAKDDLGVSKCVFFTTKGYQSGAKTVAEKNNIDLFLVRELSDEEWGLPGRHIQFYLQIISRSISNPCIPEKGVLLNPGKQISDQHISLRLGKNNGSSTQTFKPDGTPDSTLEDLIDTVSYKQLRELLKKSFTINNGIDCTRYLVHPINVKFSPPREVHNGQAKLLIPQLTFDLLIKIQQSNIMIDRLSNFHFAMMIENCISGKRHIASRKRGESQTQLNDVLREKEERGEAIQNGSILHVFTDSWFDPKEVEGLKKIDMKLSNPKN